jgi:large subunit ribosomal protein L23
METKETIEKKEIKSENKGRLRGILRRKPKEEAVAEAKPVEDPFDTLKFVLMTEKSIQLIESQNKMVFIVNKKSSKDDIKKAFENAFSAKVGEIKTMIDQKSRKKAFISLKKEGEAGEIAIRLGII